MAETNAAPEQQVMLCGGTGCKASGSDAIRDAFVREIEAHGLGARVRVGETGCNGFCAAGPIVVIQPEGIFYQRVCVDDVHEIVTCHLVQGEPLERLLYRDEQTGTVLPHLDDIPFFSRQQPVIFEHRAGIDAHSIDDYMRHGGYRAARTMLASMTPDQVIAELRRSGLRGRGGGGYPTWLKWQLTREAEGSVRYLVCNGDEGDPGAYMDRSILEGLPHAVIEGMLIAGFAVGAQHGFFYIRAEYPLAIRRVQHAIDSARDAGLLGQNLQGSGFSFDCEIRLGAGAFVCGEETALIASLEGRRGTPAPRPPYPSVRGLWGRPTVINNVETLANVPRIIDRGGAWFGAIGSPGCSGTKVFALTGKVRNAGLIEVPMGTTLREIVYDIGGGIPGDRQLKAVQTGGPSGGVIPDDLLDTPVEYEALRDLGSIMGSGGLIVMDEDDCMVDIAKFYLQFCVDESCGKCAPCRIGGMQMLKILTRITTGSGELADIDRLRTISRAMQKASLCGLGQTAPNPVVSTLHYFEREYREHIEHRRCPAGTCTALLRFDIAPERCKKCGVCARQCPAQAISGDRERGYTIEQARCVRCGACVPACPFDAIDRS